MTNQGTRRKSRSGNHSNQAKRTSARERHAAELQQYKEILLAVQASARTYAKRTGSRINPDEYPPADLAAAAYIIIRETGTRPGETTADTIRRAAYEAVRRAIRAQQHYAHTDTPEGREEAAQTSGSLLEAIAVQEAIQQAGHVAALLAQGYTPADIARRLRVSPSTAWRLAQRAREKVREALDIPAEA